MELVEGETLAQRLARGPLPVEETLEVCRQIAEGAEAAHETGFVHRDLKPANVKMAPDGKVKVLDFGLAKMAENAELLDPTRSPTITEAHTRQGVILGTAPYMSPEQAKGKTADKRADVWAFGCILYECLTGKRAFGGETVPDTIASILEREPDWQALPSGKPRLLLPVLQRCLQKTPKGRIRDIVDAWIDAEQAVAIPTAASAAGTGSRRWFFAAGAALLVAGITLNLQCESFHAS